MKKMNLIAVAALSLGMVACGDAKEEISQLSLEDFASTVCEAISSDNLEQIKLISDDKFFDQIQRMSKKKELSEFVNYVNCSELTLADKTKGSKTFTIATFGGKGKFRFAIIKKDGLYSVIS